MSSKSPGTLLIRADASPAIGVGHIMRCLALAQAWQDQGGNIVFAAATLTPAIEQRLRSEKCEVESIPEKIGSDEDAARTVEIAHTYVANWIIVDGYRFDSTYQRVIKDAGFKLLCVDDVGGHEAYFADIVLNQNLHATENIYERRQHYTRCLLGPRFALLRREFRNAPPREYKKNDRPRILVTMGGSDPENAAGCVLDAIRALSDPLEIIVVAGPANSHLEVLSENSIGAHNLRIIQNPSSMPELMSWADIAVSAAGSTVWEMCRLGLPAMLISIADNQVPVAKELHQRGISIYLGPAESLNDAEIVGALNDLLSSPERQAQMSRLGQELVDGRGAERIITAMRSSPLNIRRAKQEDCWLLWQWVNDPLVRTASFQSNTISREDHAAWFSRRLNSSDSAIYIAEDSCGTPVGQFRVEWNAEKNAVVAISVAPEKRGTGIAPAIIAEGSRTALREAGLKQLHAYVKPSNSASRRAFERARFKKIGEEPMCGQTAIHYVWTIDAAN